MSIYISDAGKTYLEEELNYTLIYQDGEDWYVDYFELIDFLEPLGLVFNEETYSIFPYDARPSQKGIYIGN